PNAVPTGAGAVGTLGLSGPYDVTTTSNTISGVNITNPAARLLIGGNSVLTLTGTSSIDGQIVVNGAAVYQLCTLTIAGPVVLNGAGSLVLNASPSDPAGTVGTASVNASGPGTLTLGSGFTLGGFGKVASVTTFNSGTVSANAPGRPLVITGGAHLNNGLYTAGGTSELRVSNAPVTQGPGGSIVPAPGGTVTLTDSPLSGGSVTGTPTGRVQLGGVSDVDGVTVHGGLDLLPGFAGRLGAAGLALGNGTVTVNSSAGYVGTSLRATVANTPVTGTGVLLLNASPGDAAAGAGTSLLSKVNNSSGSFSFGPGVTVAGFGWINGVDTTINGQVLANVDGRPLRIDGGLHQNNGVMGALAGGSLLIAGVTISQSDGASVYAAGSGASGNSVARLTNCTVTGGSLADVQLWATDTLSVNSLGGTVIVEPGALLQFAIPSVTMADAVLLVNPAGVYSGTVARVDGPFTFTGTGQVRLNASPSDPNATAGTANLAGTAGASLTFAPGVTLSGFGMINDLPTVNDSVFTADVSGRPLRFNGSTHQNNGVYRAVGGGRLVFAGATVRQAGGAQVSVGDGSAAVFTSGTVTGGAVGSPPGGTGTVSLDSGEQHFDGVT
ncbi:MAG: hypothetical protein K2Q09_11400, partial [Phycisphaerales bacterium]|nr:hypothetical protein [Phycisphaerales bacterium]